MQSRKAALAVGVALIAAAVVLFIALQGGSGSPPITKGVTVLPRCCRSTCYGEA